MPKPKVAVVLFNLGGPDSLAAVEPFLFNLFNDPAIIRLPGVFRTLLARMISKRRAPLAQEIYTKIGGRSPLLELTLEQGKALSDQLSEEWDVGCFTVMRYWHPLAKDVAQQVRRFAPDRIVLLPLYPQYSTTTTASSLKNWNEAARKAGIETIPSHTICCYPTQKGVVDAHVDLLKQAIEKHPHARVLFSAHGLPEKIVKAGDPYQWQVEQTVEAIISALADSGLDYQICYQSRVGPLKWIGPATDDEIRRAGAEGKALIIVPVAFVSEHSETLVELDMEYRHLSEEAGVPHYVRIPALGTHPDFIDGLAELCRNAVSKNITLASENGSRLCSADRRGCACARN